MASSAQPMIAVAGTQRHDLRARRSAARQTPCASALTAPGEQEGGDALLDNRLRRAQELGGEHAHGLDQHEREREEPDAQEARRVL
jgi:hypothetical protein